jgi:hypothetical protein
MSSESVSTHLIDTTAGRPAASATMPVVHGLKIGYLFSLLIAGPTAVALIACLVFECIIGTREGQKRGSRGDRCRQIVPQIRREAREDSAIGPGF